MVSILLFLAIIPVVVICTFIYRKDKNKEPGFLLVTLFLMGIASCFLVLLLTKILTLIFPFMDGQTNRNIFETMAYAFIGVALVEEFCKWIMVYIRGYINKAFDEVYDGIVYSVYVSLGFAFLENIMYVLSQKSTQLGMSVAINRAFLAVPGHACDAVFMGYYLSLAKVNSYRGRKDLERNNLILSILVPTILHGVYDFCIFSNMKIFAFVFYAFVAALYIMSLKKVFYMANQGNTNSAPINMANQPPMGNINNQLMSNDFNSQPMGNDFNNQPMNNGFNNQQMNNFQPMNNFNNQQMNNFQPMNNFNNQPMNNFNNPQMNNFQPANGFNNQPMNNFQPMNNMNQMNYCNNCGSSFVGDFCGNCGSRQN